MAPIVKQIEEEMGDEQARSMMMAGAEGFLPGKPVAVGESWKTSTDIKAPILGAITQTAQCRLYGVENGMALIAFDAKGSIDRPTETTIGDVTATFELMTVTQKGVLAFDLARGMIVSCKGTGELTMAMTMDAPNGQKIRTSTSQMMATDIAITSAETPASAPAETPASAPAKPQ